MLLGLLESQFLLVVTLASELESLPPAARAVAPDWFPRSAAACEAIRARLLSRAWRPAARPPIPKHVEAAGDNVARLLAAHEEESARSLALVASLDQAVPLRAAEPSTALEVTVRLELRLLADALSIRSPVFRHALRVAIAAAAAALIGAAVSPRHAAWVTVTALVVLQPFSGATVRRAVERTAGTVLGGLVALALTALTSHPFALALIMFPLSVAAVVTRRRSYPLFTFFLTPIFVLIATRDSGDWWIAAIRSGDTVLGGAIALATSLLVFRGVDERTGLAEALERMVGAATAYSEAVLASLGAGTERAQAHIPERRRASRPGHRQRRGGPRAAPRRAAAQRRERRARRRADHLYAPDDAGLDHARHHGRARAARGALAAGPGGPGGAIRPAGAQHRRAALARTNLSAAPERAAAVALLRSRRRWARRAGAVLLSAC